MFVVIKMKTWIPNICLMSFSFQQSVCSNQFNVGVSSSCVRKLPWCNKLILIWWVYLTVLVAMDQWAESQWLGTFVDFAIWVTLLSKSKVMNNSEKYYSVMSMQCHKFYDWYYKKKTIWLCNVSNTLYRTLQDKMLARVC